MGTCYTLFLEDEFDWHWGEDKPKKDKLKEFESKYNGYIEKIADWYGFVVYDVEKSVPYTDERLTLIKEYADRAYYTTDLGIGIKEIALPRSKQSSIDFFDDIASRRTAEEKKASEELCRQKLKEIE